MTDRDVELTVRVQVIEPRLLRLVQHHHQLCHGETATSSRRRRDAGTRVPFHLGLTEDGMRLVLFRAGHLPQAITLSDLVSAWLIENGHEATPEGGPPSSP